MKSKICCSWLTNPRLSQVPTRVIKSPPSPSPFPLQWPVWSIKDTTSSYYRSFIQPAFYTLRTYYQQNLKPPSEIQII